MNDRERPVAPMQQRPAGEARNGGIIGTADGGMSRAQKFEDEKRGIIQSCFSKRDNDGTSLESYITHIRITEDAAFPSTPAPPNSPLQNKKARLIIVSVRKTGRVRMHKARENNDGSFSIGKTWMLDDLVSMQSYTNLLVTTRLEEQQKQWAGDIGFIVTVGKPYYWQAATSKEKDFFIASLVKIYKKYTGGKVPRLIGFDERELQLLLGTPHSSTAPVKEPSQGSWQADGKAVQQPLSSGHTNRAPSREGVELVTQTSEERFPRNTRSREQIQKTSLGQLSVRPGPHSVSPSISQTLVASSRDETPPRSNGSMENDQLVVITTQLEAGRDTPNNLGMEPSGGPVQPKAMSMEHQLDSKDSSGAPGFQSSLEHAKGKGVESPHALKTEAPGRQAGDSSPTRAGAIIRIPDDIVSIKPNDRVSLLDQGSEVLGPRHDESRQADSERPPATPILASEKDRSLGAGSSVNIGQTSFLSDHREKLSIPSTKHDGDGEADPSSRGSVTSTGNLDVNIPPSLRPGSSGSAAHIKSVDNSELNIPPSLCPVSAESDNIHSTLEHPEKAVPANIPSQDMKNGESTSRTPPIASPVDPPEESTEMPPGEDQEVHRPGLGPMVKKKSTKDIVGAFRRAANAYAAFKPRPGGAGDRLMTKQKTTSNEPDGITSVVPAPLLRGLGNETTKPSDPPTAAHDTANSAQQSPKVEVMLGATDSVTQSANADEGVEKAPTTEFAGGTEAGAPSESPFQERRRRRREDNIAKYCQALDIDPALLEGRGVGFDGILTNLGWNGRLHDDGKIEDLEIDIRREIGRAQANTWLGNVENQEGKAEQLGRLIDKTITECEELDGLLTLYSHELNTLHEDVAYIEAQSQGLQVQTANQKLLENELQTLLETLSISSAELLPLKEASLSNPDDIKEIESALSTLYKAMLMIDSDVRQNKKHMADAGGDHGSVGAYADNDVGQMRAIREKKEDYRVEVKLFLQRVKQFMSVTFKVAEQKMSNAVMNSSKDPTKFDNIALNNIRQELWTYNALVLFAREVSTTEWHGIIGLYEQQAKMPYQASFRDNYAAWRKLARKASGDEHDLLFTHHDKERESDGLTTAARKLTVRRGKTVRVTGGPRVSPVDKQNGKMEPYEVFSGILQETLKMISEEQNFIAQFFHLSSLVNADFSDIVSSSRPEDRKRPTLISQTHDPDRETAKKVEQIMDGIYSFWPNDIQSLADWVMQVDPLQGVGVLFALERAIFEFEETHQEYIVHSIQKIHSRLIGVLNRFVDEQIRAIEETKVKVNKRKGVISFIRIFPDFVTAVENVLSQPSGGIYDVRVLVNEAYDKINRAMWESLKFIAKEAPGQQPGAITSAGDPEDKEALNYHILLIENMNHYMEEVDVRGLSVLEKWRDRAFQDYQEHMKLYLDTVIRRPLGKLLDFVEPTESLLSTASSPPDIAARSSHSRQAAKKLLTSYDLKEIRRGIDLLKKRIEKHFGDADDPGLSRSLVIKVFKGCEARYADAYDRIRQIIDVVYESQLELEWNKEEMSAIFRRL